MRPEKDLRPEKRAIVKEIRDQLEDSLFVILTDYKGLTVSKTGALRDRLAPLGAEYHVVKNRMLAAASEGTRYEALGRGSEGPTAIVFGSGDVAAAAKTLREFVKENDLPVIKIGAMDGVMLTQEEVLRLATLPSREELQTKLHAAIIHARSQMEHRVQDDE